MRAFWLDTTSGSSIELGRGLVRDTHIQYVLERPAAFGFTGEAAERMSRMVKRRVPYELSDYPGWLVDPLVARWVKVRVSDRNLQLTTRDRPNRRHLEAMQDFVLAKRFRQPVYLMGEPSGRILGRFSAQEFVQLRGLDKLRRVVACFAVNQVWRRPDGLSYRLLGRRRNEWDVAVGTTSGWRFRTRHLHNLVCTERLRLVRPEGLVADRLVAAGLPGLGRLVAYSPARRRSADVREDLAEERRLSGRLGAADDEAERRLIGRRLAAVRRRLDSAGLRTRPVERVTEPGGLTRDETSKPDRIAR